jgi:hypothetical protein
VIGYPPLFDGADQKRLTCVGDTGIAERFVGESGNVPEDDDVGVAEASVDAALVPIALIAYIL